MILFNVSFKVAIIYMKFKHCGKNCANSAKDIEHSEGYAILHFISDAAASKTLPNTCIYNRLEICTL